MNETFQIGNTSIIFNDIEQVINMGGPMVGNCNFGGHLLDGSYVVSPPVSSINGEKIGIVRFYPKEKRFDTPYFRLVLITLATFEINELSEDFPALCIDSIEEHKITIYESFHKEMDKYKRIIMI